MFYSTGALAGVTKVGTLGLCEELVVGIADAVHEHWGVQIVQIEKTALREDVRGPVGNTIEGQGVQVVVGDDCVGAAIQWLALVLLVSSRTSSPGGGCVSLEEASPIGEEL